MGGIFYACCKLSLANEFLLSQKLAVFFMLCSSELPNHVASFRLLTSFCFRKNSQTLTLC